jgi:antitoxin component YwqK of YwqJK toxin-antitoxin module
MKTARVFIAPAIIMLFMNCTQSGYENFVVFDMSNTDLKQHGKYLVCGDKPAQGLVNEYYPRGEIRRRSRYKNGLLHGITSTWYPNGAKESERLYERGEKEGLHAGWWPNGNRQFEYQFQDGSYHGTFKEWYESGKPLHVFEYRRGEEVSAIGWRENGRTYINFAVRNGRKYGLTNARLCFSLKDEKGAWR